MPKSDISPSELYASEQAGQWLYDTQGYCPFTRHKLEYLLHAAHEAGAASVKKTNALTSIQQQAIMKILEYHLSGDGSQMAVRLKISFRDAKDMLRILERVKAKLAGKENTNA